MAAGRPPGHRHPVGAARCTAAAGLATVAGLALAACSQGPANPANPAAVSSPAAASTGPVQGKAGQGSPARPIAPLTGLPAASAADATRPAVALAVAGSSPQGLRSADVVFEEMWTHWAQGTYGLCVKSPLSVKDILRKDLGYAGVVFTDDVLDAYVHLKMQDVTRLRMTTHPIEFDMYYSC